MQKILLTALIAGIIAGFVAFGIQSVKLSPMILQAEVYEEANSTPEPEHHHHDEAVAAHHHDENAWQPANGIERNSYSLLADIGVGVGYALLLVGAFVVSGKKIDIRSGVLWGIAGFAVFSLAPNFGLSPELPGSMAADLQARQIWWLATATATAVGLAGLVFSRSTILQMASVAVLLIPHIIGAPQPAEIGGSVPTELSAGFASASIAVTFVFWIVIGAVSGWFYGLKNKHSVSNA